MTVCHLQIMRDPETGNSRGFGFISYDSFEASDAAIEAMNGQYLCNRQITVSYAYKKDTKGERHGTPAERVLAASNPNAQKNRPHTLFASGPPTLSQANGAVPTPVAPRLLANGAAPPSTVPPFRPPPPPQVGAFPPPPMQMSGPPSWPGQPHQPQGAPPSMPPPPPPQFRPVFPNMMPPPPQGAPGLVRPLPPPMAMGGPPVWRPPPPPQQMASGPPMQQPYGMPSPLPPHSGI